jgi:hypothetical protein
LLALRILRDRFPEREDEWKMIANKGFVYMKRIHSMDTMAVERVRDEL